jgi:DNA-binding response OmpR family regulator
MTTIHPKKVFLIEDNRTEGMLLKLSLGSIENIKVTSFITGKDLLDNLSQNPDIVIADLMLPDIEGYDLIKLIRKYNKNIRIVVVSAQKDIELIAKIQEQGVFNYLVKSEACIQYLQQVIEELIIVINTNQKNI